MGIRTCGVVAILIGATVLVGWALHIPTLIRIFPEWVPMVINAALGITLGGIAIAVPSWLPRTKPWLPSICGAAILAIGAIVLLENLFEADLGVDWPMPHRWLPDLNPYPGRMAPNTSLGFVVLGAALLLSGRGARREVIARYWLAIVAIIIGIIGAIGYFLRIELLYSWHGITHMALHTAAGISVLGLGIWMEVREHYVLYKKPDEGQSILYTVVAALVTVAIIGTIGAFVLVQQRTEQITVDNLKRQHNDRAQYFDGVISQRTERAYTITTRPGAMAALRTIASSPNDNAARNVLERVAASYLPHGFRWVAFYQNNRLVAQAGTPTVNSEMSVNLVGATKRELLWSDGYYLRTRAAMLDQHGVVGEVATEQPLEILTQLTKDTDQWGNSGEMGVCTLQTELLHCFPQRFRRQAWTVPHIVDGRPLPMSLAKDGASGSVSSLDYRRQRVLAAYGPVGNTGLGMVLKMDWEELNAPIRDQLELVLAALAIIIAISVWLVRARVYPLMRALIESREDARTSEAFFIAAAENNLNGFYILESVRDEGRNIVDFRFVYINPTGAKLISNMPKSRFAGKSLCELLPQVRSDGHFEKYKQVAETGIPLNEEFPISAPDVTATWLSQQVVRLHDGVSITAYDISDRKILEEQLRYKAQYDALTGLPNRVLFHDRLESAMRRTKRYGRWMALFFLDIDYFKGINDTLGHAAGDELLRAFGDRLRCCVRASDSVARLAGDEFTIILEELHGPQDAETVAKKIGLALKTPIHLKVQDVTITSSIGIALYRNEDMTIDEITEHADRALYDAKRAGRDRYAVYQPTTDDKESDQKPA